MRRTLYWKRLLIVAAAVVLMSGAVFAVHRFQTRSQSSIYKDRAAAVATTAKTDPAQRAEAIRLYRVYLRFNPNDEAAFEQCAALYFDDAKADASPAAVEAAAAGVEDFLRAFPHHPAERMKLAELYLNTGQFQKLALARQHLEMVLSAPGYATNIEARELAATCEYALNREDISGALKHVEAAIDTGKAPVRTYVRAMELYHSRKGNQESMQRRDALLTELCTGRFANNLEARVAAARFKMLTGFPKEARTDLEFAFTSLGGDNDPEALLAMADLELASIKALEEAIPQHRKAEAHLRKAFGIDPKNVLVGMALAEILARLDHREEGIKILKQTATALGAVNDQYLMVVDRLIDLGEQEFSSSLVETRIAADPGRGVIVMYFRGRLAVLKEEWPRALKLLDEVAPNLVRVPLYHKKAMVGLAACYSAMQNPDKQLEYCRLARKDDADYPYAIVGEAEALVKMGKLDEAVQRYRSIVYALRLTDFRPELVRLELLAALAQPGGDAARDWRRFDESLEPRAANTAEMFVFEADSLVARKRAADAVKLLRKWLADHPKDPKAAAVWVSLSRVADAEKPDSGAAVLDEAQKAVGNTVEVRLARAGLLLSRPKPPSPAELDALAVDADKLSAGERFRLYFGLGQAAARVAERGPEGDASKAARTAALKHLRAAADLAPKDLTCRALLLDQALAAGRTDLMNQAIAEMAVVEGENGPVGALARIAIRLPELKAKPDPAGIKETRALAARVRDLRPGWSRIFVALAQLDELENLTDAALANYTEALEKGERQESVIRRAVELYRNKQQDDKAAGLLDKLSNDTRLPDDLERFRTIHRMLATDIPRDSRATIDRIAPLEGHTDYRLVMLRGSLLAAIREDADALAAFRRAVELRDTLPEAWAALVAQLVRQGDAEGAKRAVAEAEKKLVAPAAAPVAERADLRLAVGALHEMAGDLKAAAAHFVAAREIAPLELNPTRQLVLFLQRNGNMTQAEALMMVAKDSPAVNVARWARRHLAITLIASPEAYQRRAEALALIQLNTAGVPEEKEDPEDRKARAKVWTVDPVTRDEGVRVLRYYADRGDLPPDDYFLLAQLAFDQGKYAEAERYYVLAARIRPGVTAVHVAGLVRAYLALGLTGKAEEVVERLKTNFPRSWEAVREEARLFHRKSKDKAAQAELDDAKKLLDQAREVVKKFPGWDAGQNLVSRSGPLFEEMGLIADAEAAYTKYLTVGDPATAHAPLAVLYIRQKQPQKVLKLARAHEKTAPVLLTARLLTGAVRAKRVDSAIEAEIDQWLDKALKDAVGKPELEAALIGSRAELLDAQGKYTEAIAEYERSIAKGKSDLVVNNLCMLLALHAPARAEEAVKLMSELIAIRGPAPTFLDTRAVAYLVSSRPAEATKDLQMALVQFERAAYRFHLAWALDLDAVKERKVFAIDELKRAKQLGLTADDLHPIEYKKYVDLLTKYRLPVDDK